MPAHRKGESKIRSVALPVSKFAEQVDAGVLQVVQLLRPAGFQALLAGGCVRDRVLGRTPKDWDVVTDAGPEEGGLGLIPASHNRNVDVPGEVLDDTDEMGLVQQPELKAGDLLVRASGLAHGLAPGTGAAEPNLIVGEFINVRARPRAGIVRSDWPEEEPWMADLRPEQRAVLGVPLSPPAEAEQRQCDAALAKAQAKIAAQRKQAEIAAKRAEVAANVRNALAARSKS